MADIVWSWEHKREALEDLARYGIETYRKAAKLSERGIREITRGPQLERLRRGVELERHQQLLRASNAMAQAIESAIGQWPRAGEFVEAVMVAPPAGLPGYNPDATEAERDAAWDAIQDILNNDPDPIETLSRLYASLSVFSMVQQVRDRYGIQVASTYERQRELGMIATMFAVALDIVWPATGRLERGDVGRYVITPDLFMTLLNSKSAPPPSADDPQALEEWKQNHQLPHPIMVFRIPELAAVVETDEEGIPTTFVRDGMLEVAPAGTVEDGWDLPESELFVTTLGHLIDSLHGEGRDIVEFPRDTILVGQVSINAPVRDQPQAGLHPATMLNAMVVLGPPDPPHAFNLVGFVGRVDDVVQPELEEVSYALGGLWRSITMTLLSWFNDPKGQALRRIGTRRVTPSAMTEPKRGRKQKRRVSRYEVLGENMRWEPETLSPPGMRGDAMIRSFVRGHWYRWPRLRDMDPVLQSAIECLPELDELLIPDEMLGRPVDLEVFEATLTNCVTSLQGVDVRRRQPDIGDRLICTLLLLDKVANSPLASSPLWQRHRSELEPAALEMCRLRRTWKWPHWRGPDDGDELLAVTFLRSS